MDINLTGIITGVSITVAGTILLDVIRNTYNKKKKENKSYDGEERRESMKVIEDRNRADMKSISESLLQMKKENNESILELKKQMTDMRNEFRREVEAVSIKVDNWANKLLEFYAKKSDLDKLNDKITDLTREIGESKAEIKGIRGSTSDLNSRLNDHVDNHKS